MTTATPFQGHPFCSSQQSQTNTFLDRRFTIIKIIFGFTKSNLRVMTIEELATFETGVAKSNFQIKHTFG